MPIEGMMNSQIYTDILTKKVTPEMARRRKFPEVSEVFLQDSALCHASREVKNVFALNNIFVLDWPGNFSD